MYHHKGKLSQCHRQIVIVLVIILKTKFQVQTNNFRTISIVDRSFGTGTIKIHRNSTVKEDVEEAGKTGTSGANGISKVETRLTCKVEIKVISKEEVQEATERFFAGSVEDPTILPGTVMQQL